MPNPDFIIIGAMKCGTSTLQAQLAAQPGIFMTTPKEPNYFSDDPVYARGAGWYRGLFDGAALGDLTGEASTHYTKLPTYPETLARMTAVVPAARLIYILRDPVERAVSHYLHERSLNNIPDGFERALETNPEIIDYGRYAMQIAPFLAAYGGEALHLTSLERLTADPQGELARAAAFIGYPGRVVWEEEKSRQNVSAERVRPLPLQKLIVDNPVATALRRALVPKSVRERIRKSRTIQSRPEIAPATRRRLEKIFLEDRADLAMLFPGHPVLTECYPFAPR
jgi:hypothetical protein